jgi:hypothetical protein
MPNLHGSKNWKISVGFTVPQTQMGQFLRIVEMKKALIHET